MGSLRERVVAYANTSANLLAQLKELVELRERVKKAEKFCAAMHKSMKQKPASFYRKASTPRANWH